MPSVYSRPISPRTIRTTSAASSGDCVALPRCRIGRTCSPGSTPSITRRSVPGAEASAPAYASCETGAATSGCIRQERARKAPCAGSITAFSCMTQPSAEVSTGSGCVPWLTCGSCCGSPRSSRRCAETATAIVEASENCPASSITSRSSSPRCTRRVLEKSQAVPPTTQPRPAEACSARYPAIPSLRITVKTGSGPCGSFGAFATCSAGTPAATTRSSRFSTIACDCATTPMRYPWSFTSRAITCEAV